MEKIKYCKLGHGTDILCKKEIQLPINCFECLPSYIMASQEFSNYQYSVNCI